MLTYPELQIHYPTDKCMLRSTHDVQVVYVNVQFMQGDIQASQILLILTKVLTQLH